MVFRDGTFAEPPIASAEVQGYVYDAKLRMAELARDVWGDPERAVRLVAEGELLRERFNDAFWVDDGGYYALGLDRDKRPIDGVASNMGHLLWSGIVPPERTERVAETLLGDGLWSGWGVRTLSAAETAYNPLVYHNGTVWPHDNSLIAAGLGCAGRGADAQQILERLIEAAVHFDYRLSEVFAGFERTAERPPVVYPTASSPQAWAAGTPVLLLQALLGLEPVRAERRLRSTAGELPEWTEGGSCSASSMRSAASGRSASRRAASSSIDTTRRDGDRRRAVCCWAVSGASCRRCRSACSRRSRARSGSAPRRSA